MHEWLVASGIIEGPDGLLLVKNRRRNGSTDWSTPGGVIEVAAGESVLDGLTREVLEETGITVSAWEGPVYEVEAEAADLGWRLRVEVHRATSYAGDLVVEDHDQIVVDARWVPVDSCGSHLEACPTWVREPLTSWLADRAAGLTTYRYRVDGDDRVSLSVVRL
ncbi:MAG TPA: NUDIX hydrolase [Acidimicrobiales bacterium]|nr:NUDIX hydrolase [Acidimicrobiales bacterium]